MSLNLRKQITTNSDFKKLKNTTTITKFPTQLFLSWIPKMPAATPTPPTQAGSSTTVGNQNGKRQRSLLIATKCQYVARDLAMCSQGHLFIMSNVQNGRTLETDPVSEGPRSLSFISFPVTLQLGLLSLYCISSSRALGISWTWISTLAQPLSAFFQLGLDHW